MQVALDAWRAGEGRTSTVLGLSGADVRAGHTTLADLVVAPRAGLMGWQPAGLGPVAHRNVDVGERGVLPCIQLGLLLLRDGEEGLAVLVRGPVEHFDASRVAVEVLTSAPAAGTRFLDEVRREMTARNVYRGQVFSLAPPSSPMMGGAADVTFQRLRRTHREEVVLPGGLLERIERQTIGFAGHADRLQAAGRHLKRGLLLHGPPGTGKTFTAMYLAGRMQGRTVIVLTGRALSLIGPSCALAKQLTPATVILEDVDLVAEDRGLSPDGNPLLFELLNQMDGFDDDADVLFLLTTNRPDLLEPALATRPGRVDQAIEVPLPDVGCRHRLLDRYGHGLDLRVDDLDGVIDRTEGVTASFLRELLRRAALFAADEDPDRLVVTDAQLTAALDELLLDGGLLTRRLLGADRDEDPGSGPAPFGFPPPPLPGGPGGEGFVVLGP